MCTRKSQHLSFSRMEKTMRNLHLARTLFLLGVFTANTGCAEEPPETAPDAQPVTVVPREVERSDRQLNRPTRSSANWITFLTRCEPVSRKSAVTFRLFSRIEERKAWEPDYATTDHD